MSKTIEDGREIEWVTPCPACGKHDNGRAVDFSEYDPFAQCDDCQDSGRARKPKEKRHHFRVVFFVEAAGVLTANFVLDVWAGCRDEAISTATQVAARIIITAAFGFSKCLDLGEKDAE